MISFLFPVECRLWLQADTLSPLCRQLQWDSPHFPQVNLLWEFFWTWLKVIYLWDTPRRHLYWEIKAEHVFKKKKNILMSVFWVLLLALHDIVLFHRCEQNTMKEESIVQRLLWKTKALYFLISAWTLQIWFCKLIFS